MEEINVVLPDIPRFYTALAEWLACLFCIFEVKRRFYGWKFVGLSAMALLIQSVFLILTDGQNDVLWILCMIVAVGIMYGYIYLCGEMSARNAGYYCIRAFVIAEFAASLEWQTYCYLMMNMGWDSTAFCLAWLMFV